MSMIDDVKKLRELKQQATPGVLETEENEGGHEIRMGKAITSRGQYPCHLVIEYGHGCFEDDDNDPPENAQAAEAEANAYLISALRNLAPAMLEVLGCHEEYDSAVLKAMKSVLIGAGVQGGSPMMNVLDRNIRAAALVEKEEQG